MMSTITITTSNNESTVETADKALAQKVVDVIQNGIHGFNTPSNTTNIQPEDNLSKIEKLFELKEKGVLTEEEFIQQKSKLLNQ
ncbi:SHOCT domain-containing protein [Solitalea canadensis]|uniref:SHOCT domain-containing protein n=1 Tax=Solitalea canadensis (strain ATCC 29591 / DSM 3403 / JCM 21819 / LMG 8368 / NBRC 15130 / NCIMB 12057 / USAM 9D) TaxID=929556 RepID=H8KTA0_SOLCM|nr:SHOCT domain-containing protein [Solitalea canadensis]AFD06237.1 hypothetical protein Solca_1132 [Solitalea canadensis DSM 3403]